MNEEGAAAHTRLAPREEQHMNANQQKPEEVKDEVEEERQKNNAPTTAGSNAIVCFSFGRRNHKQKQQSTKEKRIKII